MGPPGDRMQQEPKNGLKGISGGHHLRRQSVEAVEALARIPEIESLLKQVFFLQPVQSISDSSGWKVGLVYDLLLREEAFRFQHLDDQLCRWGQTVYVYLMRRQFCAGKDDPSFLSHRSQLLIRVIFISFCCGKAAFSKKGFSGLQLMHPQSQFQARPSCSVSHRQAATAYSHEASAWRRSIELSGCSLCLLPSLPPYCPEQKSAIRKRLPALRADFLPHASPSALCSFH